MRLVVAATVVVLLHSAPVDVASAQIPARVPPPYTLMDAESRVSLQVGIETPLRGNGPCASSLAICPVSMALSRDHLLHVGLIFRNELATCSAFSLLLTQQLGQSSPEVAQESL